MADYDFELVKAIWLGWRWPVEQLGVIDAAGDGWIAEAVIDGYVEGLKNDAIATRLRSHGGVMNKEEKRARGLPAAARLGTAFYDALTERGRADPAAASRAIVSRVMRSGVWRQDEQSTAEKDRSWEVHLHPGPRCCDWALAAAHSPFGSHPRLPAPECDRPFCTCRAIAEPPPPVETPPKPWQIALGVIGFVLFVLAAMAFGKLGR